MIQPNTDTTRPVEVTHVAEATFADIHDMGVAWLAVQDAVVIHRITEPGYEEMLDRVGYVARRSNAHDEVEAAVRQDEFYPNIQNMYTQLRAQAGRLKDEPQFSISTDPGQPPKYRFDGQVRHSDVNLSKVKRATLNFTLYTASRNPWLWRLSAEADKQGLQSVDVPLARGGCVILGDNARQRSSSRLPETVDHEIVSPPSSWAGGNIKRVRLLAHN